MCVTVAQPPSYKSYHLQNKGALKNVVKEQHFFQRSMFSQLLPSVIRGSLFSAFLKYLHQPFGIPVVVMHHLVSRYREM